MNENELFDVLCYFSYCILNACNFTSRIYERFRADCIAHSVFLECLEPYILDDKLKTISPVVMQDFVKHYESKSK